MTLLSLFDRPWSEVPVVFIDTETTGVARTDRAVQVALVRFEGGAPVGEFSSLVNPGIPIPEAASAIHGITDDKIAGAPPIEDVFARDDVRALLRDAQPAAYRAAFDKQFVPAFTDPADWPWIDPLTIIREVDKFAAGKGRHKLEAACTRHGIVLACAHDALSDARAAGVLFYVLAAKAVKSGRSLGDLLRVMQEKEAAQWFDHWSWRAKQPPQTEATP